MERSNLRITLSKYRVLALLLFTLAVLAPLGAVADKYFDDVFAATFRSTQVSPSTTGVVRLSTADGIGWRNAANSGNLLLNLDGSNRLQFNGVLLATSGNIVNADINAAAAIAYSKLNLAGSIVNADVAVGAAIARTKLASGSGFRVVTNDTSGVMADAAAITASRALVSDANGIPTHATTTATEIGFVNLVTSALCGINQSCTQTNKTFTSPAINGANFNFGTASNTNRLLLPNDTTAHLSGFTNTQGLIAYDTTQNKPVYNDGSAWNAIGSGGGSGSGAKNYIADGTFESNISGVATYDDGAAYVDGFGGAPTSITISQETGSPLAGAGSLKISKAASSCVGEGATILTLTIDEYAASRGELIWQFQSDFSAANYVSGDMQLKAYDVTNAAILSVIPISGLDSSAGFQKYATKNVAKIFIPTTTRSIRLSFNCTTDNASASTWTARIDEATFGPNGVLPGTIQTGDVAWTPTFSAGWGTVTGVTAVSHRDGDHLKGNISFTAGTVAASAATITLGYNGTNNNVTIAASNLIPAAGAVVGHWGRGAATSAEFNNCVIASAGGTALAFGVTTASLGCLTQSNGSVLIGNSEVVSLDFDVPIASWNASASLTTSELLLTQVKARYYASTTSLVSGVTTDITYNTKDYDDYSLVSAATFTSPKSAYYRFKAKLQITSTWAAGNAAQIWGEKNGSSSISYGAIIWRANRVATETSTIEASDTLFLAKGDTLKIRANVEGTTPSISATNSGNQFTVEEQPNFTAFSLVSGGNPTIQRFTTGTAATYTTPNGVRWLKVRAVGGGGGGGGTGTTSGTAPGNGTDSSFGSSLITASTGGQGTNSTDGAGGGGGGACTINSPAVTLRAVAGGQGGGSGGGMGTSFFAWGSMGGSSALGGPGSSGPANAVGGNAAANSGSGGGSGGTSKTAAIKTGSAGGAGAYCEAIITSPAATYTYTVGAGGTGGTAGTSGFAGGNGGTGVIEVEEFY